MIRITFLLFLFPITLLAQFTYEFDNVIEVTVSGQQLKMPWAGGLNASQYNALDMNGDGVNDLVIYDRTSNKVNVFVAEDNDYYHAPELEYLFPEGINNWLIIKDYNCDGLPDIFTSSPFGITTYANVGNAEEPIWQIDVDPVTTVGTSGLINLKINGDDLPAIEDIDNDGDLDILTFGFTGGGEVQYHQNMSMENYGDCRALEYVRVTSRWGDFEECGCGTFAFGIDDCSHEGGREEHVGGKAILAFDADADGDFDVVIGEQECSTLWLLTNTGDLNNVIMDNPVPFPQGQPVDAFDFPAVSYLDIDFDGVKDMLISTNTSSNLSGTIDFEHSSLLYKGGNNSEFNFSINNFLQGEMVDVGQNASPAFYDYDHDGDMDMLLTSYGQTGDVFVSKLTLFENMGTRDMPSFRLLVDDYLGLSALQWTQLKIQVKNIDQDATQDLVLVGLPANTQQRQISYLSNFRLSEIKQIDFQLSSFDTPYFHDINLDGLIDLLVGKGNGNLAYYENIGTTISPSFTLGDESFYDIDVSFTQRTVAPAVSDLNGDGSVDLITTDATGILTIYPDFLTHLNAPRSGIIDNYYNSSTEQVSKIDLGIFTYPVAVDLYSSGTPVILLGTAQGGVQMLKNTDPGIPGGLGNQGIVAIYPNPSGAIVQNRILTIDAIKSVNISIISSTGSRVLEVSDVSPVNPLRIDASSLAAGVYLVIASDETGRVETDRFVIVK